MSEERDFWLVENNLCIQAFTEKPEMHPAWTLPVIHVREVAECEGQPPEPVQQKPVAWMALGACTAAPIFSDTPPDDVNLAGWEPLYRHPQPDHAAALADALNKFAGRWYAENLVKFGSDRYGLVTEAFKAGAAYRASLYETLADSGLCPNCARLGFVCGACENKDADRRASQKGGA